MAPNPRIMWATMAFVFVAALSYCQPFTGRAPQRADPGGHGVRLRPVDGGPDYYGRFSNPLPTDPSFFPVAVWVESVTRAEDTTMDRDVGINTYLGLTPDSDPSLVRAAGMRMVADRVGGAQEQANGWLISDEVDMWAGAGDSAWTGNGPGSGAICSPSTSKCGYTVQKTLSAAFPADGRLRYTNYGKGVAFWDTDAEAARFVNDFSTVVSVDTYWFTDLDMCQANEGGRYFGGGPLPAETCQRAANYGRTVDRVRSLVTPAASKPVWALVEVGHPSTVAQWPSIRPEQLYAAVWSSLIHGARGIVYFTHSLGGPCPTRHALRADCLRDLRAAASRANRQIRTLAPVLNDQYADNVLASAPEGVDTSVKWHDGHFYLFAGSTQAADQRATFSLPCVGDAQVTVLDEARTLRITHGSFTDTFHDANAVHRYRIDGGSSCGAY